MASGVEHEVARIEGAARLDLVADIGGTHSRFALSDPDAPDVALLAPRTLRNAGFDRFEDAIAHYLDGVPQRPARAALAVACPVEGDEVRLTNRHWTFRRSALSQRFGFTALEVLNDFGAIAWAVPALGTRHLVHIAGPRREPLQGPVSLVGPGTGLGVALLAGSPVTDGVVVETEGGHASFAPLDETGRALEAHLRALHGRVSIERVLSGDGLARLEAVLRRRAQDGGDVAVRDPAQVGADALSGRDPLARAAVLRWFALLGSVAGDIALLHGARTLLMAGGIVPRYLDLLRASAFHARFLEKGRLSGWLQEVDVRVVTHPHPGLLGAARRLRLGRGGDHDLRS